MKGTFPQFGQAVETIKKDAEEFVENGVLLGPDLPVSDLIDAVFEAMDPHLRDNLSRILLVEHVTRLVRTVRRRLATPKQRKFPGFEHLPFRIHADQGKIKPLADATAEDLDRYIKFLGRGYRDKRQEDPRIQEATKLRDRLKLRKQYGVTVRDVLRPVD